jgi:hypothetical protein
MTAAYLSMSPIHRVDGISFKKGGEIAVTGSKVKLEAADVILTRELVKGADILLFCDGKGNPAWDWPTGK